MRISDWSSDVCSSDLDPAQQLAHGHQVLRQLEVAERAEAAQVEQAAAGAGDAFLHEAVGERDVGGVVQDCAVLLVHRRRGSRQCFAPGPLVLRAGIERIDTGLPCLLVLQRSEEHTSELQSLMRISYAVFCLNKK